MNDIQILETTTAVCTDSFISTLIEVFAIGILIAVIVTFTGLILDSIKITAVGFIGVIVFALGIVTPSVMAPKEIRYKAVVTDKYAASAQFNEDFEVIEKDGMIYWLRERD